MKRYIRVDASKKIESAKSSPSLHQAFDGLDDRFVFDLDDEFEIYVGNDRVTCYRVEDEIIDGGAGMKYTITLNVGDNNHWQINEWIERGLDEYFTSLCDGSDYTFEIGLIKQDGYYAHFFPEIEILTDMYGLYVADVYVIPYQNIDSYGEYGIDAGYDT